MNVLKAVKNFFTSAYFPEEDKIVSEPNTLTYYHEEGHRKHYKEGNARLLLLWIQYFVIFALIFLSVQDYATAKVLLGLIVIILLYIELYAWRYAFKNYKKEIKQENLNRFI